MLGVARRGVAVPGLLLFAAQNSCKENEGQGRTTNGFISNKIIFN
jgi:hypothetical protein